MTRFADRVVFVTGASRGLGRDIALAFAQQGAQVAVGYHTKAELAGAVAAECGGRAVQIDVRDAASVAAAVGEILETLGPIDVLVNNAAVTRDGYLPMLADGDFEDALATNLTGAYHVTRAVVRQMLAKKAGAIVNVASLAGVAASPGQVGYASSKGGLIAFTQTLAAELAPRGVRVNAVVPGLLTTGMGARLDHRIVERRKAQVPVGRLGSGAEVAAAVLFLASDDASYIVGHALVVDGGLGL